MAYNIDEACESAKIRVHNFINTEFIILSHKMRDEYWNHDTHDNLTRTNKERREAITGWSKYAQLYDFSTQENTKLHHDIKDLEKEILSLKEENAELKVRVRYDETNHWMSTWIDGALTWAYESGTTDNIIKCLRLKNKIVCKY